CARLDSGLYYNFDYW
nr:immunoglobulin heavy chain junction region [Macaca mulatta]MOY18220.1 immunoglobulin heavy chain junction region [Macaca mulatta]MOY18977.1 immunoglobulin heavy chain junction region [Macaca mulatta]MOY19535.1 immunoglobulin heavy chain junction region [Macaca mulatta]MOY19725.1 immunoglobulin heavy chain junction region [Macaca mulatta]